MPKTTPDPDNCPFVWFVQLEKALRAGDRELEYDARRALARLGIDKLDWDFGKLLRIEKKEKRHARR